MRGLLMLLMWVMMRLLRLLLMVVMVMMMIMLLLLVPSVYGGGNVVVGRIVVGTAGLESGPSVDDIETGLAHSDRPRDVKRLAWYNGSALGVKDATAGPAVMLSPPGRKRGAALEALLARLVLHPVLLAQNLLLHVVQLGVDLLGRREAKGEPKRRRPRARRWSAGASSSRR
jgi:hypothetical protein